MNSEVNWFKIYFCGPYIANIYRSYPNFHSFCLLKRHNFLNSISIKLLFYIIFFTFVFLIGASCQTVADKVTADRAVTKEPSAHHPQKVEVKKVWIRETFKKNQVRPSILQSINPVIANGFLVQGNKENGLSAYTLDRGKRKWFFPIKGGLAGDVLHYKSQLFFGGMDGFLYALDLKTGNVLWKHWTGLSNISAPVRRGKYLYFAGPNTLYCLSAKKGDSVWAYSAQTKPGKFVVAGVATPLLSTKLIYFKVNDGTLIALDFKGRLKWKKQLSQKGGDWTSAVAGITMGKVCLYSAGLQTGLYCLNKKTGKTLWKTTKGSHGQVLLLGSLLFYPTQTGEVVALDQKSGKHIWSHRVLGGSMATSLVLYGDMLVYGAYRGPLTFISQKTGEILGSFTFGSGMSARPAVSMSHLALYFISHAGWLYKVRPLL